MATAVASMREAQARPAPVRRRRPAGSAITNSSRNPARNSSRNTSRVSSQGSSRGQQQSSTGPQARLRVVQPVRRNSYSLATVIITLVTLVFILVVMFQTVIAEQQLRLDKVTTDVRLARFHYDELRQERAELRAPDYLREQAMMLGMSQGLSTQFTEIPADVVASVMASTGLMDKEISQPPMLVDLASQAISGATP